MGIKVYKPTSKGRRNMSTPTFEEITKKTPEKSLLSPGRRQAGRNNQGGITVRHHGGGNRPKYRMVDFRREKSGVPAKVMAIEYDPNRTARIALLYYADGEKRYILAPVGMMVGDTIMSSPTAEIKSGTRFRFRRFRSARLFTTSNCKKVAADNWFARRAPARN